LRPSRDRLRTCLEWMAQLMQYCIFTYSLGSTYDSYAEASLRSRTAACSTMFLIRKRLMALSLGQQRLQFTQRITLL